MSTSVALRLRLRAPAGVLDIKLTSDTVFTVLLLVVAVVVLSVSTLVSSTAVSSVVAAVAVVFLVFGLYLRLVL
jgi:hypothetical protein